jgi:hypothetical protein
VRADAFILQVSEEESNGQAMFENHVNRTWTKRHDRHLPSRLYTKREREDENQALAQRHAEAWEGPNGKDAAAAATSSSSSSGAGGSDGKRKDPTGRLVSDSKGKEGAQHCANVNLQLRRHQHLFMGESEVAGWGVFLREPTEKHEFIQEYTGEQMSQEEADRRGKIYDKRNSSYIFNLNNQTVRFCTSCPELLGSQAPPSAGIYCPKQV